MPHLLVFNRSYYPDLGATGQLLTELCEDLVAHHGWEVTVVAGPPTVSLNGTNLSACDAQAGGSGSGAGLNSGWGPVHREAVRGVAVLRAAGTRLPKTRFVGRAANYVSTSPRLPWLAGGRAGPTW